MKKHWGKFFADAKTNAVVSFLWPSPLYAPTTWGHFSSFNKVSLYNMHQIAGQATWLHDSTWGHHCVRRGTQRLATCPPQQRTQQQPNAPWSGTTTVTTVSYMVEGFLTILAEILNICYNYILLPFYLLIISKFLTMSMKNHVFFWKVPLCFQECRHTEPSVWPYKLLSKTKNTLKQVVLLPLPVLPIPSPRVFQTLLCSCPAGWCLSLPMGLLAELFLPQFCMVAKPIFLRIWVLEPTWFSLPKYS